MAELKRLVLKGPYQAKHGTVRWLCVDLREEVARRFTVEPTEQATRERLRNRSRPAHGCNHDRSFQRRMKSPKTLIRMAAGRSNARRLNPRTTGPLASKQRCRPSAAIITSESIAEATLSRPGQRRLPSGTTARKDRTRVGGEHRERRVDHPGLPIECQREPPCREPVCARRSVTEMYRVAPVTFDFSRRD
jgi:hypothetical protein